MNDETIFAVALEKPDAAERAAYLDAACAGSEQRKRVEGLLAALEAAGGFLEKPAVGPVDAESAPTRDFRAPAATTPGDGPTRTQGEVSDEDADDALGFLAPAQRPDSLGRIGHYEVLEVLGRGGFGVVFRAFDDKLQRVAAVKVLAPSMAATSPARKRFIREARSAAQVQHENVVRIHDVSRDDEPLPYLVMEFVPGQTLQDRLDRTGPLETPEVIRIARQVAEGLAAAHGRGLIHRDIKPSNILIDSGPGQQVKITDFGLARAADDASLTRSGTVAGTPLYMAPEQAKGETLDHRADLFSLGSVMYAMLTGRPPFRAETTLAVLKRVADDTPRPIREVIPEVPEWLCRIVEKLHAKNPAERFQSAREVADLLADCEKQLQAHKELKDLSRIPGGVKPESKPRSNRLRVLVALGVPLMLFALVVLAVFAGPFVALSLTNQGVIGFADDTDPDVEKVLVRRDGELVATLDRVNPRAKLPPGEYELEAVCINGYVATKFHIGSTHLFSEGRSFERVEGRPIIKLVLRRGDSATVAANAARRADPLPSPSPDSDGFVSLFNGRDLSGWTTGGKAGRWRIVDGVLVGSDGPGFLFSDGKYRDFHLRVEAKLAAPGNGGVNFRENLQAELNDNPQMPTGSLVELDSKEARQTDPYPHSITPTEVWFTLEVRAVGADVWVRVNKDPWFKKRVEAPRAGGSRIGLEVLPGAEIHFRKIELRDLAPLTVTPQDREALAKLKGEWSVALGEARRAAGDALAVRFGDGDFEFRFPRGKPLAGTFRVEAANKQLLLQFPGQPALMRCAYHFEGESLRLTLAGPPGTDAAKPMTADEFLLLREMTLSLNSLRNQAIALHNYNEAQGKLPPPAILSKDGKPLLSWRVAILPYIEHGELYKQFKLDEPWDSADNKKLIEKMPEVFAPYLKPGGPGLTHYRVFVGPGTAFDPRAGAVKLNDIPDGAGVTLLIAEAAEPVVWTKPEELPFDPKGKLPRLGTSEEGILVAMAHGVGLMLAPNPDEAVLRAMITRNGGESAPKPDLKRPPQQARPVQLGCRRATPKTPEEQAKEDAAALNGEWVVRGGKVDGLPLAAEDNEEVRLFLQNGKFTLPLRDDSGYSWALTGIYTIDAAKKQLAFKFGHEPLNTPPVLCNYRVEGDALVLDFPEPKYDGHPIAGTLPFAPDRRIRSQRNLKELGAAVVGYMNAHDDALPPAAITSARDAKPLLSWRVALLPYLGEEKLYKEFKLDEPWDSAHNKKLIDKMPKVYKTPGVAAPPGHTHYRVFVGPGTAFEPRPTGAKPLTHLDFHDGLSNTILVVEFATESVVWTKPDDLPYDPKKPLPKLVGADSVGTHVLMGDGSVWQVLPKAWAAGIRDAIVRNNRDDGVDPWNEAVWNQLFRRVPRNGPAVHLEYRRAAAKPPAKKQGADPAVIQPLRDAVAARGRTVADVKKRFEAGVVGRLEVIAAEVELREAQINLAEAEGDKPILTLHLRELVKLREEERGLVAARVEVGVERAAALDAADARLAEARARLAKVAPPAVAPPPREK